MEQSKNKNVVVGLLVVIIVILLALVALLATGTISFKSNDGTTKSDNKDTSTIESDNKDTISIESLINSVKITNFTFNKPHGSTLGGGYPYTLETNMTIDLECTNDIIAGLTVKGYCLDLDNNKYLFSGPRGVRSFSCSNNSSHSQYPQFVQAYQLFKTDGSDYIIPDKTSDINWENIEIKYCKFDEAHLVLSDYSELETKIELNYEKEFK